ncbi:MAG: hypothetical protein WC867_08270 [Candidatus Pacearchaeota archaeon]|jgi:hypothetical protein
MEKPIYYSLEVSLNLIDKPNGEICKKVLEDNKELFRIAKGSKTKHQAWQGGYLDHITETMNLARLFYDSLSSTGRPLNFSISDSLLIMFLHDLEKPFKQVRGKQLGLEDRSGNKNNTQIKHFKEELIQKYGFQLNDSQLNALRYVEGENENYHPTERVMNELASFCHMCDIWSARGWYDFPKIDNDPWKNLLKIL